MKYDTKEVGSHVTKIKKGSYKVGEIYKKNYDLMSSECIQLLYMANTIPMKRINSLDFEQIKMQKYIKAHKCRNILDRMKLIETP